MPEAARTALQSVRQKPREEFMDNLAQEPEAAAPIFEETVRRLNQGLPPALSEMSLDKNIEIGDLREIEAETPNMLSEEEQNRLQQLQMARFQRLPL